MTWIYRMPDLARKRDKPGKTGLGQSTIYERIKKGTFPEPDVDLGGIPGWSDEVIDPWFESVRVR